MPSSLKYLIRLVPTYIALAVIYIAGRRLSLKKPSPMFREISLFVFWGAAAALLMMTVVPEPGDVPFADIKNPDCYNFVPFRSYFHLYGTMSRDSFIKYFIINALGNTVLFIPVGFFAGPAFGARVWQSVLIIAGMSVFIEACQVFLPRTTDVDDIILNTLGGVSGALLWAFIARAADKKKIRNKHTEEVHG